MTGVLIRLPEELAEQARCAGLLTDDAMKDRLEDAMRRQVPDAAARIRTASVPPMSGAEIGAEVKAVRAEIRSA